MSLQPLRTLFFEDLSVGMTDFGIVRGIAHEPAQACKCLPSDINLVANFRPIDRTR